ncbi:acyl-CoA dehydrogenase family protein [Actinoplanes sp. NEAU-A12]|uniref:Acyl-CoA dehydrogenase family protein n=1 Tax=Actinoplanes sandaracinus TaxID=3045177 RepID=A0ABT6WTC8_9ACTN|nr:acyl-CoA dehydrogenase family protein [Actinoplanes sandaracinus]MDI6103002.1 acyl-CoA dehydrogenase family protein [Actinoplanes sandaracinus]
MTSIAPETVRSDPERTRRRAEELFDPDLSPVLRRLGQRPRGAADAATLHPDDAAARADVADMLVELGFLAAGEAGPAVADLVEVAELIGSALYQSPFLDTVTAADLLAADPRYDALRTEIAAGERTVALAWREDGRGEPHHPAPLRLDAAGRTVTGVRRFVAFAPDVDLLLVVGRAGVEDRLVLIAPDAPGVRLRRQDDIGRGDLYEVTFDAAAVAAPGSGPAGERYPQALARARIRHAAYLAGLASGAIELSAQRLRDRTAFGRPLASMQALAFRLAALAAETTAVLAFAREAAQRADRGADVRLAGAQAAFLAADVARTASAEAVHLHGASGMTEGCDAQVFYRRAAVDASWLGTPTGLRIEAARLLAAGYAAEKRD